jgi:flavorubredoxin
MCRPVLPPHHRRMTTNTTSDPVRANMPQPYRVAPDTWVIPEIVQATPDAVVAVNSMVIAGAEPVIVDTGNELSRREWLESAFSIVDPADVRWVFLSHDDHDHIGNLGAVLELCPKATLVTNWFTVERTSRALELPIERMRWVNSGETFDAGDRTLVAMRPPIFDSPTTRGLFDPTTGVYWSVDTFACLLPGHLTDVADAPAEMWEAALLQFNRMVSPWHTLVDPARWNAYVDAVAALGMTTVASGHSAALRGERLNNAFGLIRTQPTLPSAPHPGQVDLDEIVATRAAAA